jgi:hypothetical protein
MWRRLVAVFVLVAACSRPTAEPRTVAVANWPNVRVGPWGLRTGDPLARIRTLYPSAARYGGPTLAGSIDGLPAGRDWTLVNRSDDRDPYYPQPLLAARVRDGKVVALIAPLHTEGD